MPLLILPTGKLATLDGKPLIVTQQQFENCCCKVKLRIELSGIGYDGSSTCNCCVSVNAVFGATVTGGSGSFNWTRINDVAPMNSGPCGATSPGSIALTGTGPWTLTVDFGSGFVFEKEYEDKPDLSTFNGEVLEWDGNGAQCLMTNAVCTLTAVETLPDDPELNDSCCQFIDPLSYYAIGIPVPTYNECSGNAPIFEGNYVCDELASACALNSSGHSLNGCNKCGATTFTVGGQIYLSSGTYYVVAGIGIGYCSTFRWWTTFGSWAALQTALAGTINLPNQTNPYPQWFNFYGTTATFRAFA